MLWIAHFQDASQKKNQNFKGEEEGDFPNSSDSSTSFSSDESKGSSDKESLINFEDAVAELQEKQDELFEFLEDFDKDKDDLSVEEIEKAEATKREMKYEIAGLKKKLASTQRKLHQIRNKKKR